MTINPVHAATAAPQNQQASSRAQSHPSAKPQTALPQDTVTLSAGAKASAASATSKPAGGNSSFSSGDPH